MLDDLDLFARLIEIDSTSSRSNLPVADLISDAVDAPGVRLTRIASEDDSKVNLIAIKGPDATPDRRGLTLSGHMDTVPSGDGWSSDPLTLTDKGDRLVARGSCDMKGFLALAAGVFRGAACEKLRAPLALLLTYDEEVGSLGAQRFKAICERGDAPSEAMTLPQSVLVGEPTQLRAVRMHKGHLKIRITIRGRSAHSGYPHLGSSAIEKAGRVAVALTSLRTELENERAPSRAFFPLTPFPTLNMGLIAGGEAVNVVADHCAIELGVRLLPGMTSDELIERVRQTATSAADDEKACRLEVINDSPPMLTPEEAPLNQALCCLLGQSETHSLSLASDAGTLQQMGYDCVLYGPGSIEVAHRPDEYVPKKDLADARETLRSLVRRMCIEEDSREAHTP